MQFNKCDNVDGNEHFTFINILYNILRKTKKPV